MRPTASTWAKTLLAGLLLVHLLIHPSLHVIPLIGPASPEFNSPADSDGDGLRSEGRAPCLACRIGSSTLVSGVAAETLPLNLLSERLPVVDSTFVFSLSSSPLSSRAPPTK